MQFNAFTINVLRILLLLGQVLTSVRESYRSGFSLVSNSLTVNAVDILKAL